MLCDASANYDTTISCFYLLTDSSGDSDVATGAVRTFSMTVVLLSYNGGCNTNMRPDVEVPANTFKWLEQPGPLVIC